MKIRVIKPIKITEVGTMLLPVDFETEISDSAGKIFVEKGFVSEIKDIKKIEVKAETVKAEKPIINKKPGRKAKK